MELKSFSELKACLVGYTMLYAPQFSHTPLYRPQIRNADTILIVIDGKIVSF